MSGSASSFEAHLEAWEARRLVGGRELDAMEHAATLAVGNGMIEVTGNPRRR